MARRIIAAVNRCAAQNPKYRGIKTLPHQRALGLKSKTSNYAGGKRRRGFQTDSSPYLCKCLTGFRGCVMLAGIAVIILQ